MSGTKESDSDPIFTRRNLLLLTEAELNIYRAIVDVFTARPDWKNRVAECACPGPVLHPPTRVCLLNLEERLLRCTVPYWDFHNNPEIPQAFLDNHYIHPIDGRRRVNPLRFPRNTLPPSVDANVVTEEQRRGNIMERTSGFRQFRSTPLHTEIVDPPHWPMAAFESLLASSKDVVSGSQFGGAATINEEDKIPHVVFDKVGGTGDGFSVEAFLVPEGGVLSAGVAKMIPTAVGG